MSLTKRLAKRRNRWLLVLGVLAILYYLSARLSLYASYTMKFGQVVIAQASTGTLELRWDRGIGFYPSDRRFNWNCVTYRFRLETPWRPYHHAWVPWPGTSSFHGLVIPLWSVPAACLLYVLYLHGRVRGAALALSGRCHACGYDLGGRPADDRESPCPECGERP